MEARLIKLNASLDIKIQSHPPNSVSQWDLPSLHHLIVPLNFGISNKEPVSPSILGPNAMICIYLTQKQEWCLLTMTVR